eukprot:TRINITY_DN48879_c0_g1_i1.p5 TRINITY_DN48879_c0_g1~~TRINITY_DN48879_c0_g1_i1.p5  ORF type:complete len:155 (+),score=27.12 TRINITY_DN48879_c0_g1_i1:40-504(+)
MGTCAGGQAVEAAPATPAARLVRGPRDRTDGGNRTAAKATAAAADDGSCHAPSSNEAGNEARGDPSSAAAPDPASNAASTIQAVFRATQARRQRRSRDLAGANNAACCREAAAQSSASRAAATTAAQAAAVQRSNQARAARTLQAAWRRHRELS